MADAGITHSPDVGRPPQIGILCIDIAQRLLDILPAGDMKSYISVSYVKFLESAGAEIVPIWIGKDRSYYENILSKLNGILIPGGSINFNSNPNCNLPNDCVQSSKFIYAISKNLNDQGIHFPIWGTCLGFQLLLYHATCDEEKHKLRDDCEPMDNSLPIRFEAGFRTSKMFSNLNEDMEKLMETEPFGFHYHRFCITKEALNRFGLSEDWQILACNEDSQGKEFITLIEHRKYPFYGSQVHLERVEHENLDDESDHCNHSKICIELANYFAKFFVSECRKSSNCFALDAERTSCSIRNFQPIWTKIAPKPHWRECYLFSTQPEYNDN